jgi:hypothetical protein
MDEQDILGHLLKVESEASALVRDAQTEGDRRIAESEKRGRAQYDERYGQEVLALDARYERETAELAEIYNRQLETYREDLKKRSVDTEAFFHLLDALFMKGS